MCRERTIYNENGEITTTLILQQQKKTGASKTRKIEGSAHMIIFSQVKYH